MVGIVVAAFEDFFKAGFGRALRVQAVLVLVDRVGAQVETPSGSAIASVLASRRTKIPIVHSGSASFSTGIFPPVHTIDPKELLLLNVLLIYLMFLHLFHSGSDKCPCTPLFYRITYFHLTERTTENA